MSSGATTTDNASNNSNNNQIDNDERYTIDIRVFLAVIVVSMMISFSLGVGIVGNGGGGGTANYSNGLTRTSTATDLSPVTSVVVQQASNAATAAGGSKIDLVNNGDGEVHEPAGQHLLVDLKGVEADFLDSEERLSKAMVDTVNHAGLTLLSYHCHKLIPKGVSCVGVLLESHISFHTWPDEGVITLDLFTCGNKPLIPAVATIQELFGIPRANEQVKIQWSHELRGFRTHENKNVSVLDHNSDLSQLVWSPIDIVVKKQIVSKLTKYQRVDIWDIVGLEDTPTHEEALKYELQAGDPRWLTPELVQPSRFFFLDGVLQSVTSNQAEYHEALVHPGMFSHPNPKKVAIVGGAEGATLREVLKHKTVEEVTMIEIDEELIGLLREHMPSMSNCSDFVGRAENCFDDASTKLVLQDAQSWFETNKDDPQVKFDVVVLDAIEPGQGLAISKDLYDTPQVLQNILKTLSDDGIMILQVGRAPTILDPRPDIGFNAPRERLFRSLESMDDVQAMFVYEDAHCGFLEPRAFMVVCKSVSCRERFYGTADEMDYQIYDRIVKTHSKRRALTYFDGVTHLGYQVAPKAWETIYCRREPTPFECNYRHLAFDKEIFEFNIEDESKGAFTVTATYVDENEEEIAETKLWANVDIPKGSYIMPEHMASSLSLSQQAYNNLKDNLQYGGVSIIEDFVNVIDEYGHHSKAAGSSRILVEIGASYFIRSVDSEEEANVGRWIPPHPAGKRPKYSPVYERHRLSFDVFMVATKDIPKGSELIRYSKMWDSE